MGKDLEKCEKVTKPELALKSRKLDSIIFQNLSTFTELKLLKIENKNFDKRLKELNQDLLKAEKQKKNGWIIPGTAGVILGVIIKSL